MTFLKWLLVPSDKVLSSRRLLETWILIRLIMFGPIAISVFVVLLRIGIGL